MTHLMLNNNSNSIAYQFVKEVIDHDEWRATYINTNDNLSNLLTNTFPYGEKRTKFCKMLLYNI